ncbi:MAG: tetratricopeptide repeat protein [Casimicrobiaceae bacterium]
MIDPAYGDWLARGQAHQQAGLPIDAMLCYRQALKLNRNAVQAQFHLGEVLRDLGLRNEAIAAWRGALSWQPRHVPSLLAQAELLRSAGAVADAATYYRQILGVEPAHVGARTALALTQASAGESAALHDLAARLDTDGDSFDAWDALGHALAAAPPSPSRSALLQRVSARGAAALPTLLLGLGAEDAAQAGDIGTAHALLGHARTMAAQIDDPEALRWLALASAWVDTDAHWAQRYAAHALRTHAPSLPVMWPRRTAGAAVRIAYLLAPGRPLVVAGEPIEFAAYLEHVVAAHPRDRIAADAFIVDDTPVGASSVAGLRGMRVAHLGHAPDTGLARALAENDYDALIDLAGMAAATGPLLAARPARSIWTLPALRGSHAAPLVTDLLPAPERATLATHRAAIEAALTDVVRPEASAAPNGGLSAPALIAAWRLAIATHQTGAADAALAAHRHVLTDQPEFAPAQFFSGVLLRDRGDIAAAQAAFAAALEAAPGYRDARTALANLLRDGDNAEAAAALCREGLAQDERDPALWRALGLAELARRDAVPANDAFERALALAPADGETHYNHGVALQTLHRRDEALRAYQRALAFSPDLLAADFNIGVVFQEQGRTDAAIAAFEKVLAREPKHALAHKALGDTLLAARRIDDWLRVFARFEAACPNALSLVVQALEVYQYRGDFAGIDRYLDRLRHGDFKPDNETDLADSLEQLLFIMLYFDLEPEAQLNLYRTYDSVAKRVYGIPLPPATTRHPGKLRIGYLSGDVRNHVMGKMMWAAIQHHDRERFEIYCYSVTSDNDELTQSYRGFCHRFEVVGELSDRVAAEHIAADDLDVLVDLSTHTKNAKPGVLALKPARVQITHIASAGATGLAAIDFKLTDAYCDIPENQPYLIEKLLPMAGCVYPYRHVAPATEHPFHRAPMGIAPDTIVIGAFVNPLKLSRRCLSLWREVLDRIPKAMLALSPLSPEARDVCARLLGAAGVPLQRVLLLPQGRNDAEGQARFNVVDFALDPLPYGGVNSTLEALDMGVPVVTLCGRKHGERTSYSILANLGVTQTIAASGSEYVDIAVRLATDPAFRANVRAAITNGIRHSMLTDMPAHARALEAAYVSALAKTHPDALERAAS